MEFLSAIVAASFFFTVSFLLFRSHRKEIATGNAGKGFWAAWGLTIAFGTGLLRFESHPFVWDVLCDVAGMLIVAAVVYGASLIQHHLQSLPRSDLPQGRSDR